MRVKWRRSEPPRNAASVPSPPAIGASSEVNSVSIALSTTKREAARAVFDERADTHARVSCSEVQPGHLAGTIHPRPQQDSYRSRQLAVIYRIRGARRPYVLIGCPSNR